MQKIKVLDDAVEHVRRRRAMYLGREEVIPENLATAIANDALTLGVGKVEIHHREDWWLIASDEDWLIKENSCPIQETFRKLLPLAGGGPEALRREILLAAFASVVFTRKGQELIQIAGGGLDDKKGALAKCLKAIPANCRVVGFKL